MNDEFQVGEIVTVIRSMVGRPVPYDVEVVGPLMLRLVDEGWAWTYKTRGPDGRERVARPFQLRRRRPPEQVVRWSECAWRPRVTS